MTELARARKAKHPKRWYREIQKDFAQIADAIVWFEEELEDSTKCLNIDGYLEVSNQEHPGWVAYYDAIHSDLELIMEFLKRMENRLRAKRLKEWADDPPSNVSFKPTDLKTLLEDEPDISELVDLGAEIKYLHKHFSAILTGLDQKSYSLSNITKLRAAGMEEVEL